MDKQKLESMVESIIQRNQGSYFATRDALNELIRKLRADNVSSALISYVLDVVDNLKKDSLSGLPDSLADEVRGGYLDLDRAVTLAERYGHDSNALYNATKDAVRGCFY